MTDFSFFVKTDGGRAAAGYTGTAGDCCCRAVALASGLPYQVVYDKINELAKSERRGKRKRGRSSAREGVYRGLMPKLLDALGLEWRWTATMKIGSGCKVLLKNDDKHKGEQ